MPQLAFTLDIDPEALYKQRLLLAYLGEHDKSGVVEGLLQLTDVIADRCSDEGFKEALLTGTQEEHTLGCKMVATLTYDLLNGAVARYK